MARIIPVKLPSSSKALWFDANGVEAIKGDPVVVLTARGNEFGTVAENPFEATPEQIASLKSALKPVRRLATQEDIETAEALKQRGLDAMPAYRELAEEEGLEMRPISVEFLFDGDKAVFYFESDDRVDFRELVRKLAGKFKVRVDMRQIGVRDEARMVGGLGHCGQELCCKRLGGEFCPVSIRMAKEQDLSLNPQKISGICGRLMCCLRYEYDAYKDFKSRAPKMGAQINTPDGTGKVVNLDVPKEIITIQVADDKKIKVPLADMSKSSEENARPDTVDAEAWERAANQEELSIFGDANFLTSQFTSSDKLGEAKVAYRESSSKKEKASKASSKEAVSGNSRSSRKSREKAEKAAAEQIAAARKPRRRSTKLAGGVVVTEAAEVPREAKVVDETPKSTDQGAGRRQRRRRDRGAKPADQAVAPKEAKAKEPKVAKEAPEQANPECAERSDRRRRRRDRGSKPATGTRVEPVNNGQQAPAEGKQSLRPGHRSSSLRQRGGEGKPSAEEKPVQSGETTSGTNEEKRSNRRPRRRRRSSGQGNSTEKSE